VAQLDQEQSHTGGIFAVSWSPDSKSLLTSSADSTCKIWDLEARKAVTTVELSQGIQDQQVGNLWAGEYLLSLALSGDLYYLDPRQSVPVRTVYGHQRSITAFAVDSDSQSFFTASYTGRVFSWTMDGHAQPVKGSGHTNQVSGFAVDSGSLWSIGMDDTVRCIDISKKEFTYVN
jgi:WD40 repeat protein